MGPTYICVLHMFTYVYGTFRDSWKLPRDMMNGEVPK